MVSDELPQNFTQRTVLMTCYLDTCLSGIDTVLADQSGSLE